VRRSVTFTVRHGRWAFRRRLCVTPHVTQNTKGRRSNRKIKGGIASYA
jgi:hypothetical protein